MTRKKRLPASRVPVIEFRTSWIYNQQWTRPKKFAIPPSDAEWRKRYAALIAVWRKEGTKVLRTISATTGLPWLEDRIIVYLTWGVRPFSDPLTLNLRADPVFVADVLTHELLHRHISPLKNWKRIEKRWFNLIKPYRKEPRVMVNHIVIHALHEVIVKKLYDEARLTSIKTGLLLPDYIRSWEVVDELGAEKIVQDIFRLGARKK